MAAYVDEEEFWKCASHPSRRRRIGVCHRCLRERLTSLCPECAESRPCSCSSTCSSNSSSSSAGRASSNSNQMEMEPSFRRSRSLAIPFLRSSSRNHPGKKASTPAPSLWSVLKGSKKKQEIKKEEGGEEEQRLRMMRKSRSVAVTASDSESVRSEWSRGWHFPSPMKVFRRQSVSSRSGGGLVLVQGQERPPLHRA